MVNPISVGKVLKEVADISLEFFGGGYKAWVKASDGKKHVISDLYPDPVDAEREAHKNLSDPEFLGRWEANTPGITLPSSVKRLVVEPTILADRGAKGKGIKGAIVLPTLEAQTFSESEDSQTKTFPYDPYSEGRQGLIESGPEQDHIMFPEVPKLYF